MFAIYVGRDDRESNRYEGERKRKEIDRERKLPKGH